MKIIFENSNPVQSSVDYISYNSKSLIIKNLIFSLAVIMLMVVTALLSNLKVALAVITFVVILDILLCALLLNLPKSQEKKLGLCGQTKSIEIFEDDRIVSIGFGTYQQYRYEHSYTLILQVVETVDQLFIQTKLGAVISINKSDIIEGEFMELKLKLTVMLSSKYTYKNINTAKIKK